MKNFYERPTQVKFWDYDNHEWCYGIAYGEEIICAECGGIFEIDEVIEYGKEEVTTPIHEYDTWIDLSSEIYGGEEPESFVIEAELSAEIDEEEEDA